VKNRLMPSLFLSFVLGTLWVVPSVAVKAHEARAKTAAATTVGGPLAKELQGKPAVVDIYATWCGGCRAIAPTLSDIRTQYKDEINFVVLDVTDRKTRQRAEASAKRLGLTNFLKENRKNTSTVAIIDPATGEILKEFQANPNKNDYVVAINEATSRIKK
jgi:thiol-disulfide isomerase/thioredoxin